MARTSILAALFLTASIASACTRPERSIVDKFFTDSRLRDTTALRRFSTVTFEPLEQGIVLDFDIDTVAKEEDTKTVTVSAQVKRPDGRVEPATILVMMQRRKADDPARATDGDWRITGLIEKH